MLKRLNMNCCSPSNAPLVKVGQISKLQCSKNNFEREAMKHIIYTSAVESLMYAQTISWPDKAYGLSVLGRLLSNPRKDH